jgi:hypothetical protein
MNHVFARIFAPISALLARAHRPWSRSQITGFRDGTDGMNRVCSRCSTAEVGGDGLAVEAWS